MLNIIFDTVKDVWNLENQIVMHYYYLLPLKYQTLQFLEENLSPAFPIFYQLNPKFHRGTKSGKRYGIAILYQS